jgi:hypothetical protein
MGKMPLEWHRKSLSNMRDTLSEEREFVVKLEARMALLDAQIAEAVRQGRDCFDEDRFLKPRKAS